MSMGGHQSAAAISTTWLTPQPIIDALGGWQSFDLDPCAAPMPRPWFTAWQHNAESDGDAYRHFARHPKAERNPNWRAKVRQKLQQVGNRIERNAYVTAA